MPLFMCRIRVDMAIYYVNISDIDYTIQISSLVIIMKYCLRENKF